VILAVFCEIGNIGQKSRAIFERKMRVVKKSAKILKISEKILLSALLMP
jgi:hypothetical protein